MKNHLLRTAAILAWAAATLSCADAGSQAGTASQADQYLTAMTKGGRFTGSVLIAHGGNIIISKGYGLANIELNVPNTPQTRFRLGSITKQFTATAILQLELQGKLSVEDRLSKYFPDATPAWGKVTVHHLLTHTSGIPSFTSSPDYVKRMREAATPADMIARFKEKPLEFEPGEKFRYSNSGYFLLGQIVEKVSGDSYENYIRKHVLEPAGMRNSGYDHPEVILPNRAAGYTYGKDGVRNAAFLDMGQPYSAGSLYSSTEDLSLWDQALYTEKVLPKKALDRMFTPFKGDYGYGWFISKRFNRNTIEHGGGINGFSTMLIRFPDEKLCLVVLGNSDRAWVPRVARDLAAIVLGEKFEPPE